MTNLSLGIYDSNQPGQLLGPTVINSYSALTIAAYWRGVNFLANGLRSFRKSVRKNGVEIQHPADQWLKRKPNPYQTNPMLWGQSYAQTIQEGNGFLLIRRTSPTSNQIASIENVGPYDISPYRYQGKQYYHVLSEYDRLLDEGATEQDAQIGSNIRDEDMIHFYGLGFDGMIGYPPVVLLRECVQRARNLDLYLSKFLQRGTLIRGSIEIPAGLSDEKVEAMVAMFRTYFTGPTAERDLAVLTDGAKLNNATLSPQDSQLDKQMAYTNLQIAQVLGVPLHHLLDDHDGRYNPNIQTGGEALIEETYRPWLDVIEAELSDKLLTQQEQASGLRVHLDTTKLTRGDQSLTTVLSQQRKTGVITANEMRRQLGYPPSTDPEAEKLVMVGDTTPHPAPQAAQVTAATSPSPKRTDYGALKPVWEHIAQKVDRKTSKAFDARQEKPQEDLTRWSNVFCDEQKRMVLEELQPVAETLAKLDGPAIDLARIGERYAQQVRKRAADGTPTDLTKLIEGEITNGKE